MKRFLMLFTLIATLIANVAISETLYVCTNGDDLNGRAAPSKNADIEMRIPNGEKVEAVSYRGGWVEVLGGETGTVWCKAEYLSSAQEAAEYRNSSGGRVFVRDGIEGAKTGLVVRANDTVSVSREINGWGYIRSGWVNLKFFDPE